MINLYFFLLLLSQGNNFGAANKIPKPQAINFNTLNSSYQSMINALPDSMQESASDFYLWQTITAQFINPDGSYPTAKSQPQQKQQYCKGNWSAVGITGNADEDYVGGCSAQPDNVGRIDAISFKPNDANTIFIGTEGGQIYQRIDNTNNVTSVTGIDNKFPNGIAVIAVAPSQSKTIYVASGNGVSYYAFGSNFSCSDGVWKSIDGGVSFNPVNVLNWGTASNTSITDIAVNPSNPNNVWVVGHQFFSPLFNQKPNGTVWHSLDGGKTWVTVNLSDNFFWHIKYSPDGKNLYLSGHKLYKSTNNGSTWTQVILPGAIIDTTKMSSFIEIAVCPHGCPAADNSTVAAFVEDSSSLTYCISTDAFKTIAVQKIIPTGIGTWALRPAAVAMGVNSGGGVYLCTAGAFLDYHNYDNVFTSSYGIDHQDVRCIASPPYNGLNAGTFYAGTDGGLFVSHDGGETWKSENAGLNCGLILGVDVSANGNMTLGMQDNAVFYSAYLNGYQFHHEYFGDGATVMFDRNDNSIFYGQDFQATGEVYRASSTGSFCKEIVRVGNAVDPHASPIPMALDQSDKLYMGWKELYSFNGETTTQTTNLQSQFPNAGYITAIAVSKYSSQTVCIATQGAWSSSNYNDPASYMTNNLFISHDGGATWMNISPQIPAVKGQITSVLLDCEVAGDVWFAMGGYTDLNNKNENVFYSFEPVVPHDLWIKQSSGLPQVPTTKIVEDDNNTMYVATDLGVYYTNASLAYQWKCFSLNLPTTRIMDLEIHNGIVYAGTWGRGLWQSPVLGSEPEIEASASDYFPTSNAKWVYEVYQPGGSGYSYHYIYDFSTGGDTMINGMNYTKMDNAAGEAFFYRVDDKKVYAHDIPSDDLLMDFGLTTGDTLWNIYHAVDTSTHPFYSWVAGEDSVLLLDGKMHRRMHIVNNNVLPETYWIEGVGNLWNLISWWSEEPFEGYVDNLTCFYQDGQKVYSAPSPSGMFDCDTRVTGISSQPQSDIIAYSKNGQIIIKNTSQAAGNLTIYNINGQPVTYAYLPIGEYEISQKLITGVYIIRLNSQSIKVIIP